MSNFYLCRTCWQRLGRVRSLVRTVDRKCYICKGLFSKVKIYAARIKKELKEYEFNNISVGVRISREIQEREDEVRSILRIHGTPSVKSQFLNMLIKHIKNSFIVGANPELLIIVDTSTRNIEYISKSIYFYGRYTKDQGISQRKIQCKVCNGEGCEACKGKGEMMPSVESFISKGLLRISRGRDVIITWLGREEPDSIVYPPGRPFIAEVREPKKRNLMRTINFTGLSGRITVTGTFLAERPKYPILRQTLKFFLEGDYNLDDIKRVEEFFSDREVQVLKGSGNKALKKVYYIKFDRGNKNVLQTEIDLGIPPRSLVEGGVVSPSISEILKAKVRCLKFDIVRVDEVGGLSFA